MDTRILQYKGRIITWAQAQEAQPHDATDPNHTFYFHLDDERVIDGSQGGNSARWINHSCDPNCIAEEDNGRVFIRTLRPILMGEELSYDYSLMIDEPLTDALKAEFACHCGSVSCRGTLLDPDQDDADAPDGASEHA